MANFPNQLESTSAISECPGLQMLTGPEKLTACLCIERRKKGGDKVSPEDNME